MYEFSRRAFLKGLGKVTAAMGMGVTLGAGCEKQEPQGPGGEKSQTASQLFDPSAIKERYAKAKAASEGRGKYIMALSCGSENGQCETFLKAAAMGAAEFGVETEIIKASTLKVNVLEAGPDDDVDWILDKTILEDCALICAVPCYHVRANSLYYAISERCNSLIDNDSDVWHNVRVGAVIGVGGSGYDAWASLTNQATEIFMQHTRKIVDQVNFAFCGLREWNLWMQQGQPLTSNTHKQRVTDMGQELSRTAWGPQPTYLEWYKMAIERAKELGRNVARAMDVPIEQAEYKGEKSGVECPVCHCNIVMVPESLPHLYCPICAVRGTINDNWQVVWNMEDARKSRLSKFGMRHHGEWLAKDTDRRRREGWDEVEAIKKSIHDNSNAKIVSPI